MARRTPKGVSPEQLARLVRLPGTARQFLDPETGEVIPRRRVQTTKLGGRSPERAAFETRVRRAGLAFDESADRLLRDYVKTQRSRGNKVSSKAAQRSPEFFDVLRGLKGKSNAYNGPKARALVELGYRSPGDTHPVGHLYLDRGGNRVSRRAGGRRPRSRRYNRRGRS